MVRNGERVGGLKRTMAEGESGTKEETNIARQVAVLPDFAIPSNLTDFCRGARGEFDFNP